MKGSWHLVSLSVGVGLLANALDQTITIVCYCFWLWWIYKKRMVRFFPLLWCLIGFAFGNVIYDHSPGLTKDSVLYEDKDEYKGEIVSPVKRTPEMISFVFHEEASTLKTQVTYFKNDEHENLRQLKHGSTCTLIGKKEAPSSATNPGQFNYRAYLYKNNISHQVTLSNLENITCTGASKLQPLYQLRQAMLVKIEANLSPYTGRWVKALILGDDSDFNEKTEELFQRWSLSHLLAISGLHVGLMVGMVYLLLVKFNIVTKEKAQLVILCMLPIYAILAGGEPSVWRASLMTILFIMFMKLRKKINATDGLSFVFLFLLLVNPSLVNHIGFQFSFLVTFGLLLSKKLLKHASSKLHTSLIISLVCQLVILPLQVQHFYFLNPMSVLVNLFMIPYFSAIVMPLMFLLLLASFTLPLLATNLEKLFEVVNEQVMASLNWLDKSVYFPWVLGEFPAIFMALFYLVMILFMIKLETMHKLRAFAFGCLMVFVIAAVSLKPYISNVGTVTMLDVGQGDSFVIELPHRQAVIFIDAAGKLNYDFSSNSDKTFKDVLQPYLYSRGISHIDSMILTHEDIDHVGSVPYVVDRFDVEQLVISPFFEVPEQWHNKLSASDGKVVRVTGGSQISINGLPLTIFNPLKEYDSKNDNSLVFYTEIGGLKWLFTGDVGVDVEKDMLKNFSLPPVDVLKVPHHGSKTSTSLELLERVEPKVAWISVGKDNRYGHPAKDVVDKLNAMGVTIMRTDMTGAVQFRFLNNRGTFLEYVP